MNDSQNKKDEIDLSPIFYWIKNYAITFWSFIIYIIFLLRKRWWVFLLFVCIILGAGYRLFLTTKPTFISSLTISSGILSNDHCADMINDLQRIIKDNSVGLLARKLDIDTVIAHEIGYIEFSNYNEKLVKKYEDKDTIVLGIPFKIIVYANNNTIFEEVEAALVKYLENNKYAMKLKEIKRQNLESMRNKLGYEMLQLDTLKKNISANILPRGNTSGFVFGQPIDPVNIYNADIALFKSDLTLKEQIQLIDGIQVIDSFSPREEPDSPVLWKKIILFTPLLLIAFIFAHFLERKRE